MRWASLTPETTQWIYALGRGSALVARSHLCQEPPEVERLPSCTRPGAVPPGWEKYVAPYAPDFGVLSTLKVEGVLTIFPAGVPDLDRGKLEELFQKAVGYSLRLVSLEATDWEALQQKLKEVGRHLQAESAAHKWLSQAQARLSRLQSVVSKVTARARAVFLQPGFPLRPVGGWSAILAKWAGLEVALPDKPFLWEKLLEVDPDLIVLAVPGGSLSAAGQALAAWARQAPVQHLSAFRQKRLYAFKGTAGLFYPSPALASAAEALYELAYTPTYRANQHLGSLWAPLL